MSILIKIILKLFCIYECKCSYTTIMGLAPIFKLMRVLSMISAIFYMISAKYLKFV